MASNNTIKVSHVLPYTYLLSFIVEVIILAISLIIPGFLLIKSFSLGVFPFIISLIISYYIFIIGITILGALVYRLSPKPKLGIINTGKEMAKYAFMSSIIIFVHRFIDRKTLHIFPLPGFLFYRICGAKIPLDLNMLGMQWNLEPHLLSIGKGTIIGADAVLTCHYVSHNKFVLGKIELGENVLVGVHTVIWADVKIGDNSVVAENSSVKPGTKIPSNQLWGGNPAKFIKKL